MSRLRKDRITKGICWAVLWVVVFSFVFSLPVLNFRSRVSHVRQAVVAADVTKCISCNENAELEETLRLREEPLHSFVQRIFPTIVIRILVSNRSDGIIPTNHTPINCPLLI